MVTVVPPAVEPKLGLIPLTAGPVPLTVAPVPTIRKLVQVTSSVAKLSQRAAEPVVSSLGKTVTLWPAPGRMGGADVYAQLVSAKSPVAFRAAHTLPELETVPTVVAPSAY